METDLKCTSDEIEIEKDQNNLTSFFLILKSKNGIYIYLYTSMEGILNRVAPIKSHNVSDFLILLTM